MDCGCQLKALAGVGSPAASGGLSTPAFSQGVVAQALRFMPQAIPVNFHAGHAATQGGVASLAKGPLNLRFGGRRGQREKA